MSQRSEAPRKSALLIGGGAPNSTLMAGALVAFHEADLHFDVISCSGAGALMGLLYQAPKNGDPVQALTDWAKIGVSDAIYQQFPVNYKVFMKPGQAAEQYRNWLMNNPLTAPFYDPASPFGSGLYSDWIKLLFATLSPSDLSADSLGLCAHLPFADQLIDYQALQQRDSEFYINAYNVTRQQMQIWNKQQVTSEHLKAAFSFPYIYPPYHLDGDDYIEGAAIDTLNFKALVSDEPDARGCETDIDTLVIFDILGADKMIQIPDSLYDAWVKSIIIPLVEIAKDDIALFEYRHNLDQHGKPKRKLLKVDLMGGISPEQWPQVLDWSNSNLETLFQLGYQAGQQFAAAHPELKRSKGRAQLSAVA